MDREEFGEKLKKELEDIFREQGDKLAEVPPCAYHRLAPPPGCILGWDLAECNFCSFYKPVEGKR